MLGVVSAPDRVSPMGVKITLVLAGLALLAAGCGSGDSSTSYSDAASVAKAAHCTGFKKQSPEWFAAGAGACRFEGHDETIQWFRDPSHVKSWVDTGVTASKAFGIDSDGEILSGHNWTIECDARSDCKALKALLGGSIT